MRPFFKFKRSSPNQLGRWPAVQEVAWVVPGTGMLCWGWVIAPSLATLLIVFRCKGGTYIHRHMLSHRLSPSRNFFHCHWPPNRAGNSFVSKFPSPVPWLFSLCWVKHELAAPLIGKPSTRKNKCMEQLSSRVPCPPSSQAVNSFSFIWTETWWELHWTGNTPSSRESHRQDTVSHRCGCQAAGTRGAHGPRLLTLVKEGNSLTCLFSLKVKLIVSLKTAVPAVFAVSEKMGRSWSNPWYPWRTRRKEQKGLRVRKFKKNGEFNLKKTQATKEK